MSGVNVPTCPRSKHSHSGRMPAAFMTPNSARISEMGFANTKSNTKSPRDLENFA